MTNRNPERPGPPENVYFERLVASTEQATRAAAPMLKGAACAQLELTALAGRRARAYLDIPNALARCRGPQDLLAAQTQFWQTAFEDYSTFNRRVVAALSATNPVAPTSEDAGTQRRERDTLTFADVFTFNPWTLPDRAPKEREVSRGRAA